MGTNFYYEPPITDHEAPRPQRLHIGKSSAGWCVSLRAYPEHELNTLGDWVLLLSAVPQGRIFNEYGDAYSIRAMISQISDRGHKQVDAEALAASAHANDGLVGPNGLLRHKLGRGCVGHGPGPWDYIEGDFS